MTPLDFYAERDAETDSWERSHPDRALIEPVRLNCWRVMLPGGETHVVELERENGAYTGECDCKGWDRDDDASPCAHLCAVRRADYDNEHGLAETTDTYGQPIRVVDPDEVVRGVLLARNPEPDTTFSIISTAIYPPNTIAASRRNAVSVSRSK